MAEMRSWIPLVLPSIGWHAYYGGFGALGAWLAIGVLLAGRLHLVVVLLALLMTLRAARARTPSWDWGDEWYQRRAGTMLEDIRSRLLELHPHLEPRSRLFFASIPNNIGLIAGRSPAVRVWYADSSLEADFYSGYRPRPEGAFAGRDRFFKFDTLSGLVEVDADGPAPSNPGQAIQWEQSQEVLAMLFLRNGDPERAATRFQEIGRLSHRPDALVLASAAWAVAGEPRRSDSLLHAVKARLPIPASDVYAWRMRLVASVPRPSRVDRTPQ